MRGFRSLLSGALALLALLGASCGRERDAAPGRAERRLTVAVRADITGVFPEPPTQRESFTIDLFSNVLEGPFRLDENLAVQPALVSTWTNPDDRTWVFRLREGIRFSDGTPLTSTDVVASLRAAVEKPFPTGAFLSAISKVEASGPFEFRVTTREPSAVLPSYLTGAFVISARALAMSPILPVGTGPYVYAGREPGKEIRLTRNRFHEPAAPFDEVLLRVLPDPVERVAALLAGRVDIADALPLDAVERRSRESGLVALTRPGIRVLYLAPRVDRPPFSDLRVREALDLAIDRDELNARVYHGRGTPASQPVPVAVAGYDASIPVVRADRTQARARSRGLARRRDRRRPRRSERSLPERRGARPRGEAPDGARGLPRHGEGEAEGGVLPLPREGGGAALPLRLGVRHARSGRHPERRLPFARHLGGAERQLPGPRRLRRRRCHRRGDPGDGGGAEARTPARGDEPASRAPGDDSARRHARDDRVLETDLLDASPDVRPEASRGRPGPAALTADGGPPRGSRRTGVPWARP
ncbi:MAG: hypothetical protein IPP07_17615 [Holophagales bacterium]|nr:hypothetical protein [Holophagales bacterium]